MWAPGFDPWVGKISWRRDGYPLQCSGLEGSMDCIVHGGHAELDTMAGHEHLFIPSPLVTFCPEISSVRSVSCILHSPRFSPSSCHPQIHSAFVGFPLQCLLSPYMLSELGHSSETYKPWGYSHLFQSLPQRNREAKVSFWVIERSWGSLKDKIYFKLCLKNDTTWKFSP